MKRALVLSGLVRVAGLSGLLVSTAVAADWPDLSKPARAIGGDENDAGGFTS